MSHTPLYQAHAAPTDRHWNRRRLFLLMIALMVLSLGAVGLGRGFAAPTGTTAGAMEIEAGGSGGARIGLLASLRDRFGGEPNKSQAPATTATTVIAPSPVATVEVHMIAGGAVPATATGARTGTDVASVTPVLAVYSIRGHILALSRPDWQEIRPDGVNGQHRRRDPAAG